ncbi:MAG: hypothetical protein IJR07_02025 [Bacteroidaceae bacterium]|nr:hypothetical protein [Bacteroidaceae bacterium]
MISKADVKKIKTIFKKRTTTSDIRLKHQLKVITIPVPGSNGEEPAGIPIDKGSRSFLLPY